MLLCAGMRAPIAGATHAGPCISDVSHYRSYDGLCSERVYSILQSGDGAVWFATRAGVDRYNGHGFKHYGLKEGLSAADYAGRVIKLFRHRGHTMCAFDNKGRIFCYNERLDAFELEVRLSDHLRGDVILNAVTGTQDGSMLLGLARGVFRYRDGCLSCLLDNVSVNDIEIDDNVVYAATTGSLTVIRAGRRPQTLLPGVNLQTVRCDGHAGKVFLGSFDRGLWQYDSGNGSVSRLGASEKVFERPIRAIVRLDNRHLAVGIDGGGVYLYDTAGDTASLLINTDESKRFCLNGNGVYALLHDSFGTLWTGSYTGGVSALQFSRASVIPFLHKPGSVNTVRNNNINGVAQSGSGDIWFATDGGISILSPASGRWQHPQPRDVIVCLEPTDDGGMLAGTYGCGIYRLDAQGNVVANVTKQSGALTSNSIFSILRDAEGRYWAASLDGGVMCLDGNLRPLHTYPVNVAFSLVATPDGRIAVGTANGYFIIDPNSRKISQFAGSDEFGGKGSSYIISMLYESPQQVWLGTEGGGLYLYDQRRRRIVRNYTTADGLPSNDVYCILRDDSGRMVLSTSNGLAMRQGSRFKALNYLPGSAREYNKSSGCLLKNGNMIFGSVYGAEQLPPSQLAGADFSASIRITGLTGSLAPNEGETAGAAAADMSRRLEFDGKTARLDYDDNSFTIHFEAINLPFQSDIVYQYILQGYDRAWSSQTAHTEVEYKNVSPGNYTFRVRSVRRSDGSVLDETALPLIVGTPWWASWWAWTLYVLLGFGVVAFIFRYNWLKLRERHDSDKIRFFINTAHDIRTPVSLVMAPVNDLRADTSLSPAARRLVETASANINKLYSVTTQLLEFERFDSGGQRASLEPVDMRGLLTLEVECFRDACRRKNIELVTELGADSPVISGDRYLLEMLFDNLLSNACKYTEAGGRIAVVMTADRRRVQISVRDNGIGIPTRDRRKVLREVYRAVNARRTNAVGTGFGLLQARRITELLDGTIRLQSEEGVGTVVTVTFKRIEASAEAADAKLTRIFVDSGVRIDPERVPPAGLEPQTGEAGSQRHSLLIVEDNDDLRGYLADMFAPAYHVHAVACAEEALEHLAGNYPDLVLSDVMMPGMHGDELCRRIKSDEATSGIPVVLLTAKADHDSMVGGLECGADDYIPKPFSSDILRLKVQGIIANRDRLRHQLLNQAINRAAAKATAVAEEPAAVGEVTQAEASADAQFVAKATDLVVSNMADSEFGIDALCREMAMSRSLFYTRLKALTGQAPQDFIRLLRLERAAELLRQHVPVAEVAERCGFANVKYFSTIFKKHFGLQPSRFAAHEAEVQA